MESKKMIWLGLMLGSFVGSYIPNLWGAGILSFSGILFSAIGGIAGIYIGFKISQ